MRDLLLQDLIMPRTDGLQPVQQLRALPRGKRIPILACSGDLSGIEEAREREVGFTGYLIEPVDPIRLLQALHHDLG
jgi:CheY-like chemotaxis protein